MKHLVPITALGLCALGGASAGAATIYNDRTAFLAAIGAHTTETFPSPTSGNINWGSTFVGKDFTIVDPWGPIFTIVPQFSPGFYDWNSGPVLDTEGDEVVMSTSAHAIGFDFGNPPAYDSSNGTLTINGVDYGGYAKPVFAFFGIISDAPIGDLTIGGNGGLGVLDNVTTPSADAGVVPEPAAWTMLITGFGTIGALSRRRRHYAVA